MIENENQYQRSQKKLAELITAIDEVTESNLHPLRNQLLLASLKNVKQEIEEEISLYKSVNNKP